MDLTHHEILALSTVRGENNQQPEEKKTK